MRVNRPVDLNYGNGKDQPRDWSEGVGLAKYKTRVQLLRLLEALGIERKGG